MTSSDPFVADDLFVVYATACRQAYAAEQTLRRLKFAYHDAPLDEIEAAVPAMRRIIARAADANQRVAMAWAAIEAAGMGDSEFDAWRKSRHAERVAA